MTKPLQMATKVRQELLDDLSAGKDKNLDKAVELLNRLNKLMLTNLEFVSGSSEESLRDELRITRDVLEIRAFWSIAKKDIPSFERYISQLKCYYLEHQNDISESPYKYELVGLNFLCHLGQNRLDEFHAELRLFSHIDDHILDNDNIRHVVCLERYLKEGDYSKISAAKQSVTTEAYIYLIDKLLPKNKPLTPQAEKFIKSNDHPSDESTRIEECVIKTSTSTEDKILLNDLSLNDTSTLDDESHADDTDVPLHFQFISNREVTTEPLNSMNTTFQNEKEGSSMTDPWRTDAETGMDISYQFEDQSTLTEAFMMDASTWTNDNPLERMVQSSLTDQWLRNVGTIMNKPQKEHQSTSTDTFVKEMSTSTKEKLHEQMNQSSLTDPCTYDAEISTEEPMKAHSEDKCISTDALFKDISTSTNNKIQGTVDQSSSTHPWRYNETSTEVPSEISHDLTCPNSLIEEGSKTSVKENVDEGSTENTDNCSPPPSKCLKKISSQPFMRLGLSRRIGKCRKPLHQLNSKSD